MVATTPNKIQVMDEQDVEEDGRAGQMGYKDGQFKGKNHETHSRKSTSPKIANFIDDISLDPSESFQNNIKKSKMSIKAQRK